MSKVYSVYELFDAAGKVLYVGQSSRPPGRADKHAERVNWVTRTGDVSHERQPLYVALAKSYDRLVAGTDIMRIIESGFETRKVAEGAEKAQVDWHNAWGTRLYNKAGNHQLTLAKPPHSGAISSVPASRRDSVGCRAWNQPYAESSNSQIVGGARRAWRNCSVELSAKRQG